MHPFPIEPLAFERRRLFLREAEQARLVRSARRKSAGRLGVRALEAGDIHRLAALYDGLSPRSRFLRFMAPIHTLPAAVLEGLANIDHDRHEAIGAFDRRGLVAAAHWFRSQRLPHHADIAIEVADPYQRRGIGTRLLRQLGRRARRRGIGEFGGTLLAQNTGAIGLLRATGWPLTLTADGAELTVTMALDTEPAQPGERR
jgi:GNAT superfamily N-acetyltransferase